MMFTEALRDGDAGGGTPPGLDHMGARDYRGTLGRFTSPDPENAGADPSSPGSWNMYSYVNNNPLSYTDPSGEGIFGTIGAFIGSIFPGLSTLIGWGIGSIADLITGQPITPPGVIGWGSSNIGSIAGGVNSGPWNEQPPIGVGSGGGLNTGTVFGSGNTGPFVFSLSPNGPPTGGFSFGWNWLWGTLASQLYYPANHPAARDMRRSTVVQNLRHAYIEAGCPANFPITSGHAGPWKESAGNLIVGDTTQFQVGGFNGTFATGPDGAVSSSTIFNTAGWSSLTGESTWGPKFGLKANALDTQRGLGHNVEQTFTWTEPNPCHP
jgi:RHS repeat-associated protein